MINNLSIIYFSNNLYLIMYLEAITSKYIIKYKKWFKDFKFCARKPKVRLKRGGDEKFSSLIFCLLKKNNNKKEQHNSKLGHFSKNN